MGSYPHEAPQPFSNILRGELEEVSHLENTDVHGRRHLADTFVQKRRSLERMIKRVRQREATGCRDLIFKRIVF